MKRFLNILLIIFTTLFIIGSAFMIYCLVITVGEKLDNSKLNINKSYIEIVDSDNNLIENQYKQTFIKIDDLPNHVKNAFVSIEDKRFYKHNGTDFKRMIKATLKNVATFSFKEGASTISQQLIKNTHLTSKKTMGRKLKEIKLAKELESKYSKDEILEMYLNTIYFGEGCYGINNASIKYFGKTCDKLDISESAMLAGIIKAPSNYSPFKNYKNAIKRRNTVLNCMYKQGYINENEYEKSLNCEIVLNDVANDSQNFYSNYVFSQLDRLKIKLNEVGKYTVITNLYSNYSKIVSNAISNYVDNCLYEVYVLDKNGNIIQAQSNGEIVKRNVGSILKPVIVYAPCIEEDIINPMTKIEDAKTDFNGYCPSNYNNDYKGFISINKAINCSSNVVAVKCLNYLSMPKVKKYTKKLGFTLDDKVDYNLSLALGCCMDGFSLQDVCLSYTSMLNDGDYISSSFISKVINPSGKVIYENKVKKSKVFSQSTTSLINILLKDNVKNGTGKKLSYLPFEVCCKTGTVGNTKGNSDALSIAYTTDYIIGVRLYNKDGYMPNNITGGSQPTLIIRDILDNIYRDKKPNDFSFKDVVKVGIDKEEYQLHNKIYMADECAKKDKIEYGYFKIDNLPKYKEISFEKPKVKNAKISVNNKEITIRLHLTENTHFKVYKIKNDQEKMIYDSYINGLTDIVYDKDILANEYYQYYILPYTLKDKKQINGARFYLKKIKTPNNVENPSLPNDWWKD